MRVRKLKLSGNKIKRVLMPESGKQKVERRGGDSGMDKQNIQVAGSIWNVEKEKKRKKLEEEERSLPNTHSGNRP